MTTTSAAEALKKLVGVESPPVMYEVEKGHIKRFAQAIGDSSPLWTDEAQARKGHNGGIIAPPTFLRAFEPAPFPENVKSPYSRVLDGGSEWEYFEPVRPGDRITVVQRFIDVAERAGRMGPMLFMVREMRYTNQFGQLVATQRATGISY